MRKKERSTNNRILKNRVLPIGAEIVDGKGTHFRVWAPKRNKVEVTFGWDINSLVEVRILDKEDDGYFSLLVPEIRNGVFYGFKLDDGEKIYPDPASKFQPDGPHRPSQVVDHNDFEWSDKKWKGIRPNQRIIYEMHIGTFTQEGTWQAAVEQLENLADLGITILEIMPISEFPGRRGWGYDGVSLFATYHHYGAVNDFKSFVDRAHSLGMSVILDVVYNHLGPDANYLGAFSDDYFTKKYNNEWGDAINFDDKNSEYVREFFISNAIYWIKEFHLDGLRLDATQQIFDNSENHIIKEITEEIREAAKGKTLFIVGENEPQETKLVLPPEKGGYGIDALWNDDFHHSARVALTGKNEAYYTDYLGKPQEFISALKYGYLFQGQRYKWQNNSRGTPTFGISINSFVNFIQNHDQIANSARGLRIHELTSIGKYKTMTALMILAPGTPMLFQGQEFAATTPFLYFVDHNENLNQMITKGRSDFLAQFRNIATKEMQKELSDPADPETFEKSKLNHDDRKKNYQIFQLHKDLINIKQNDPVISNIKPKSYDGAILSNEAFLIRFFTNDEKDRLLIVNLGSNLHLDVAPEPLLAPHKNKCWKILWSSEDPKYGGNGTAPLDTDENWKIPGHSAVLLIPENNKEDEVWII